MVTHSFGSIYYRTLLCIAFPFHKIIEIMIVWGQKIQEISKTLIYPVVNPYFWGPPPQKNRFCTTRILSRREPVFICIYPVVTRRKNMGFWAWFLTASHATFSTWRREAEGPKTIISVQLWGTLTTSGMETVEDLDGNVFSNNTIYINRIDKMIKCGMRGIEGKWIFDAISVTW